MISFLDTDYYTFTVGQVVFNQFPEATAQFKFINRGTERFNEDFVTKLRGCIRDISKITLTKDEFKWLKENTLLKEHYLEWLMGYQFNLDELDVKCEDDQLSITIDGPWRRVLMWEVPLLSTISELYYSGLEIEDRNITNKKTRDKCQLLDDNKVYWSDFGTRRRHSFWHHAETLKICSEYKCFRGTSNVYLAQKQNLKPIGTMSHQGPMGMQGIYNLNHADINWICSWEKEYGKDLRIYLPDTLTTDFFLKQTGLSFIRNWNGVRQDSGCPHASINKIVDKYKELGIDPKTKRIICSDGLTAQKLVDIVKAHPEINIEGGVGTSLTNDIGLKPLNIVIKMTKCNGKDVVKLSDDLGKATGMGHAQHEAMKTISLIKE